MEELKNRLEKVISSLEEQAEQFKLVESFDKRIKKIEYEVEMLLTQSQTIITQQGAVRIAIKNIKASLESAASKFSSGVSSLAAGFSTVEDDLRGTLGYTKQEIEKMTAQEYKLNILRPLGMDRSWQK